MTSYLAGLVSDTAPGLAVALIAVAAAAPPNFVLCRSTRGRARSAIGYLLGLGAGLTVTVTLAAILGAHADAAAIATAGLLASFFAPFVGLARGKWYGRRRPPRRSAVVEGMPR